MLLSFIIPVYNVEAFVGFCLQSILSDPVDADSFEVIIINDGSKDQSMSVVRKICAGHENIHILDQNNQGLSAARMNGLKMAQGEYIWFVDSDDWLESNAIDVVLKLIGKIHPDVIVTPLHWRFSDSNNDFIDINISCDKICGGQEYLFDTLFPAFAAPRFIIKKVLFEDNDWLFFPSNLLHEDEYFGRILLYLVGHTYILKDSLYNYRQRDNSIIGVFCEKNMYDLVKIYDLLNKFNINVVKSEDRLLFRRNIFQNVLISTHYRQLAPPERKQYSKFILRHSLFFLTEYLKTKPRNSSKVIGDILFILFPLFFIKKIGLRHLQWG